jgi:hypothetical protein
MTLAEEIKLLEKYSKPELSQMVTHIVGRQGQSKTKHELVRLLASHGVRNEMNYKNRANSNRMANNAMMNAIFHRNKVIRNLQTETRVYNKVRGARGKDPVEMLLNSIRARDEMILKLRRMLNKGKRSSR